MDLVKIGRFIAALRKEQGLTQEQLGEKLGVTGKTVSRWETGTYLPPAEALVSMSDLFVVSINELLSGKWLSAAEYRQAAEENLSEAIRASSFSLKERIAFFKKKWRKEHTALIIISILIVIGVLAAGLILKKALVIAAGVLLIPLAYSCLRNAMMTYVEHRAYDGSGS